METEKGSKPCGLRCGPALLAIWKVRKFRCEEAVAREWRAEETEPKKGGDDDVGRDEEYGEAIMASFFNASSTMFCGAQPHFKL